MNILFEILCYNCATTWQVNHIESREFVENGCFRCKKDLSKDKYDSKWELFTA
jgi:hypothetical protein